MKNICIIGATGYIGSFLTRYLLAGKFEGKVFSVSRKNTTNINWMKSDSELVSILDDSGIDVIVNCMGNANVDFCESNADENVSSNFDSVRRLLAILNQMQKKPLLVHFSSIYVFGKDEVYACHNEEALPNPSNKYGVMKLLAEEEIGKTYLNYLILRLPLMFGNSTHKDDLVSKLETQLYSKETLNLNQTFTQIRYPTSVSALADFLVKEIFTNEFRPTGKVIHFSSSLALSRNDLVDFILGSNRSNVKINIEKDINIAYRPENLKISTIFPNIEKYHTITKIEDLFKKADY